MRYEIIIVFKSDYSATKFESKSLQEVNNWLKECVDDTVQSVDVKDNIRKTSVTYNGSQISKGAFL